MDRGCPPSFANVTFDAEEALDSTGMLAWVDRPSVSQSIRQKTEYVLMGHA